jgi:hypothetical protein
LPVLCDLCDKTVKPTTTPRDLGSKYRYRNFGIIRQYSPKFRKGAKDHSLLKFNNFSGYGPVKNGEKQTVAVGAQYLRSNGVMP